MLRTGSSDLLSTIETLYQIALSPGQYDTIAEGLDDYISDLDPDSDQALTLREHIDKALQILERLHALSETPTLPEDIVEAEHGPAAITNVHGDVIACNGLWQSQHGTALSNAEHLAGDERSRALIRSAIRSLHDISDHRTSFVRVESRDDNYILLSVSRLPRSPDDEIPTRYMLRTGEAIWSESIADLMVAEFDLTPAEINLLRSMVRGATFQEISEETGRAVETLKSQSKSIYRKMHAAGREDAIRIAYQLHLLLKSGQFIKNTTVTSKRLIVRVGRHDRHLNFVRYGKPGGEPVLFLHGMSLGHGLTEAFERQLVARKAEMFCIDRPGYGASDPASNIRSNIDEWIEMFPQVLDQLGLGTVPVLTHTSGVLYGCAAASNHPDRITMIAALAGGVPITDSYMLSDYPLQIRLLSRASRFSPQLLRFVFASFVASYRSEKGRNKIIHRTYGNVPSDAAALTDPVISGLVHQGMAMVVGNGFDGVVGDGLRIFNDWSDYVSQMTIPLHYIIGEEDPICPLIWAQSFAQRYEHVSVSSIPAAGQLLHHTQPEAVFGILDEIGFWDQSN